MEARFRILAVDGGGIRGIIPAMVVAELERRVSELRDAPWRIADGFHLVAGTSTGGLIALALTVPDPERPVRPKISGQQLVELYREAGPEIFERSLLRRLPGRSLIDPKYTDARLREQLQRWLGAAPVSAALRELLVTAYDMTHRRPLLFKRWQAASGGRIDPPMVAAGLATAAAPTYFPSQGLAGGEDEGERALVDGGVYANNPTLAAVAEALKRTEQPGAALSPQELLVVSLGTGSHQVGFSQRRVRGWGLLGWIIPRGGRRLDPFDGEPALLGAIFDGQSDTAHHWTHMIVNHQPGSPAARAQDMGAGPRYWRLQPKIPPGIALDDAGALPKLEDAAEQLIEARDGELDEIARQLASQPPLPPDPPLSPDRR